MEKIYTSASKLVFLGMALAVIAGLFVGKIESSDFMSLAFMSFTFYFAAKPLNKKGEIDK